MSDIDRPGPEVAAAAKAAAIAAARAAAIVAARAAGAKAIAATVGHATAARAAATVLAAAAVAGCAAGSAPTVGPNPNQPTLPVWSNPPSWLRPLLPQAMLEPRAPADSVQRVLDAQQLPAAASDEVGGLAVLSAREGDRLLVAQGKSLAAFDVRTGQPVEAPGFEAPAAPVVLVMGERTLLLSSRSAGRVLKVDRASGKAVASFDGLKAPAAAVELADGSVVVAESGAGRVLRLAIGQPPATLVEGLSEPTGLVADGRGLFLTETGSGTLWRIDPVTGQRVAVVRGLARPQAIARGVDGRLVVAEAGQRRIVAIDPATGGIEPLGQAGEAPPLGTVAAGGKPGGAPGAGSPGAGSSGRAAPAAGAAGAASAPAGTAQPQATPARAAAAGGSSTTASTATASPASTTTAPPVATTTSPSPSPSGPVGAPVRFASVAVGRDGAVYYRFAPAPEVWRIAPR